MSRTISHKRSLVKAVSYRAVILCLDLITVWLITGKITLALGFTLISNSYCTIVYFGHERIWAKIQWGIGEKNAADGGDGI